MSGLEGADETQYHDSESDFSETGFNNFPKDPVLDSDVISCVSPGNQYSAPLPKAPVRRSGR